jgi:hypothetical protein
MKPFIGLLCVWILVGCSNEVHGLNNEKIIDSILEGSRWVKYDSWGKQMIEFLKEENLLVITTDQSKSQGVTVKTVMTARYVVNRSDSSMTVTGNVIKVVSYILNKKKERMDDFRLNEQVQLSISVVDSNTVKVERGASMFWHITHEKIDKTWRRY